MKRFLVLCGTIFLLAGCGSEDGEGDQSPSPTNDNTPGITIEKPGMRFIIPSSWREIAAAEFSDAVLSRDPIVVFRRREADGGIYPNLVVTSEQIASNVTALEFSRQIRENNAATLLDYEEIQSREEQIAGQLTTVTEFTARSAPDERLLRFWQTGLVQNSRGLVVTAVLSPQSSDSIPGEIARIFDNIGLK